MRRPGYFRTKYACDNAQHEHAIKWCKGAAIALTDELPMPRSHIISRLAWPLCACSLDTFGISAPQTSATSSTTGTNASENPPPTGSDGPANSSSGEGPTQDAATNSPSDGDSGTDPTESSPLQPRCGDDPPRGATLAPAIPPYAGSCPPLATGLTPNTLPQVVGMDEYDRTFLIVVPGDLRPDEHLPVVFLWHNLGGSAADFHARTEVQEAVDQLRFLAVIPEARNSDQGVLFGWPFSVLETQNQLNSEFQFFDDMLACVHEQFIVDKDCISAVGLSSGGLFASQLAGGRSDTLASFVSLSGGTGGALVQPWTHPQHRLPAMVLWGGPNDVCVSINFEQTSQDLEQNLEADGHFVLECIHNCNHSTPPFDPPMGATAFATVWDFVLAHPYWLEPGVSPYTTEGLPDTAPSWCAIGVGHAVPPPEVCDKNECS